MAINDINKLRLLNLFQGSDVVRAEKVQPPVFGTAAPPTDINAEQSYEDLFPQAQNDISQVRVQNVMSPPAEQEKSLMDIINEHYTPETRDTERFRNLLDQFPERNPSFMDKLAGAGAYLGNLQRHIQGGPDVAEKVKYAPFTRELEDWKAKTEPTHQLANLEKTANANERILAGQIGTAEYNQRKLDQQQRIADTKAEIAEHNIELQRLKYNNPDLKFDYSGVMVKVADPRSGKITVTNIPTDKVSETTRLATSVERANIMAQGAENRANIQAATAEDRAWTTIMVDDPDNPGKTIAVDHNAITGEDRPVAPSRGRQSSTVYKPGALPSGKLVQPANIAAIQAMTKEVLDILNNEILDVSGKEPILRPNIGSAVGASRALPTRYLPATEQRAADRTLSRLKDLLTLQLIGAMKEQSKTGATGFGQLTGRELDVLESAASKLDPALDEATFTAELKRIREKLQKVMLPADGLNPTVTPNKKPTAAELIKKYGGQ